nr:FAD-dependent oxidoreductase [Streptomyces sp. NBC_00857]
MAGFQTGFTPRPELVVGATDAEEVRAAVARAAAHGWPVRVQATGHGLPGASEGGLLIATRRMDGVRIDAAARTARVEAGVRWRQVIEAAVPRGPLAQLRLRRRLPYGGAVRRGDGASARRAEGRLRPGEPLPVNGTNDGTDHERRQPRRPMSFQVVGSAPIARAALSASPSRKGTRPAATAALSDMPADIAR